VAASASSATARPATATTCAAPRVQGVHQHQLDHRRPEDLRPGSFVDITGDECIIPPNSFALARTVEYFRIPRDVLVVCLGKSTYARCGIIVNVTPLEPEWEGHVTLEFSNTTPLPARIYANEGVAQMLFFRPMPTTSARPRTATAAASTRARPA
jgi:deoxycytidine triphosphate deaminase